jgi:Mn2+/Fe2+ NRAMP family transporter
VGAGDLATGAFAGSKLGVAVLWAVLLGAGLKLVLNEGLTRWQLATGSTLLEGCIAHLGRPVRWLFLAYLLVWSYFVGAALMSACGVAAHAICPLFSATTDKVLYGLLHSAAAVVLVKLGGYRLFEKVMAGCIAVMFLVVVATAVAVRPPWQELIHGLLVPTIPDIHGKGLGWTVGLMGGVGGTVTVLCYGYWIREEGRLGPDQLKTCRIDLAVGYTMTAVFGLAMVVIGSNIDVEGRGATLLVDLADQLQAALGWLGRWLFLVGAWAAIFSSLLGVWQSVPYLFADFCRLTRKPRSASAPTRVDTRSLPYQAYLLAIAALPATVLPWTGFEQIQRLYAIIGAMFIPMLALVLLVLNGQSRLVGREHRNSPWISTVLVAALALAVLFGWFKLQGLLLR